MKVLAITWDSYYGVLKRAAKNLQGILEVKAYSSRHFEEEPKKVEEALREAQYVNAILLYRSTESIWELLEKELQETGKKIPIVCVGHSSSYWSLSTVKADILAKVYTYILYGGEENFTNMLKYIAREVCGMDIEAPSPKALPWEGLYHPDSDNIFTDIEEYLSWYRKRKFSHTKRPTVGILFSRHSWVYKNLEVENSLIKGLEEKGFDVISGFTYSLKDEALGTKGPGELILKWFIDKEGNPRIDALIKLIFFFLASNRKRELDNVEVASEGVEILKKLNVPVISPVISYYKTIDEWEREELNRDIGWSIALPEFEGVIEPIIVAAQVKGEEAERRKMPIEERIKKLIDRISRWIELRNTPPKERKVAFILHNNPCASVEATVGAAAHLDSLESVVEIMKKMKEAGYEVDPPVNGKALIEEIMNKKAISEFRWTTVEEIIQKGGALALIDKDEYLQWFKELPEKTQLRIIDSWGNPPGEYKNGIPPAMLYNGKIVITGLRFGNVLVMVQPKRGCAGSRCDGQVCRILHDPDTPPPHQYIATYKWLSRKFKVHAVIHVGTHGNLEFLPGKGVALSSACLPDICIDTMPHLYIYNADNPPEGTIAKRRSYAVLVDHMQTVLVESGLYEELLELERILSEYEEAKRKDPARVEVLKHMIMEAIVKANLDKEIKVIWEGKKVTLSELSHEEIHQIPFEKIVEEAHSKLSLIRNTQIQDGMHIFGKIPEGDRRVDFIYSIMRYDAGEESSLRKEIAKLLGYRLEEILANPQKVDSLTGKSYGAISEELDRICKRVIKYVLEEVHRARD